jgi:hypothetical protein
LLLLFLVAFCLACQVQTVQIGHAQAVAHSALDAILDDMTNDDHAHIHDLTLLLARLLLVLACYYFRRLAAAAVLLSLLLAARFACFQLRVLFAICLQCCCCCC